MRRDGHLQVLISAQERSEFIFLDIYEKELQNIAKNKWTLNLDTAVCCVCRPLPYSGDPFICFTEPGVLDHGVIMDRSL